jgi:hypothetical protein
MIIIILGVLLFILVVLRLFTIHEGFEVNSLDQEFINKYKSFISFYNPFMVSWNRAISSSIALDTVQKPLTSPSQITTSSPPQPSSDEMNQYITQLTQKLNIQLPQYTDPFPQEIDTTMLNTIIDKIPNDVTPFLNALNWMNGHLSKAHDGLGNALQGKSSQVEGFDSCQDIGQCIANNPALISQISNQISQKQKQSQSDLEAQITAKLDNFNSNQDLQNAFKLNNDLLEKSQDIQNKAQSGELFKQINIQSTNPPIKYTMPSGANNLKDMEQNDPEKYNTYKKNYSSMFGIKQLIDQINSTL